MNVMGIIFANDANLGDLTNKRTMASLPFGAAIARLTSHCPICATPASAMWASFPAITTNL